MQGTILFHEKEKYVEFLSFNEQLNINDITGKSKYTI